MERIVVGVSGASGVPYARRLLEELARYETVETHLVISAGAREVMRREGYDPVELERLAGFVYDPADMGASLASGSFRTGGMVIAPASATTVGKLAAGIADNLLLRAAYVHLKERRPLVVLLRETPLPLPTLRALTALAEAGAVIMPASPGFYNRPSGIEDLLDFMIQRILDHLGLEAGGPRWEAE
ncbi:UbiX family flavin prenyltransferase [Oceanithermus sp.]